MKKNKVRIPALLIAIAMLVAMLPGMVLPTFARGELLWGPFAGRNTIYVAYDEDLVMDSDEGYIYAATSSDLASGNSRTAILVGSTFYVYASEQIQNVYYDLTGANQTLGALFSGGQNRNFTPQPVPAILTSKGEFLAGPYKAASGEDFYYMDATNAAQGVTRDYALQGPESYSPKTDIAVFYNPATGDTTPLSEYILPGAELPAADKPPVPGGIKGPDVNGDYYKPTDTPNIYEVVSDDQGTPKIPAKFVFDTDKNGNPLDGGNLVVKPGGDGKWYTENPSGIYREIDANGHPKSDTVGIWVGDDGIFGNGDDKPATKKSDGKWYADMGQNIYYDVDGPNRGKLVGGGWDYNPVTNPVFPIVEINGTYYVGPMQDGEGVDYYYGDPATGGNGLIESSAANISADDVIWYVGLDGNMTTTKPATPLPAGVIENADGFWKLIPGVGDGDNIYVKVTVSGSTATPVTDIDGIKIIVDKYSKSPGNAPTLADDRWYDVNDLDDSDVDPADYDGNSDGYLNPTEYVAYMNGIAAKAITNGMPIATNGRLLDAGAAGQFIEIATNSGYSLIVRTSRIQLSTGGTWPYPDSAVRGIVNAWWRNSGFAAFNGYAVQNDVASKSGTPADNFAHNNFSVPSTTLATLNDEDIAFMLSYGEAAEFCSLKWCGPDWQYRDSNSIAVSNWNRLADKGEMWWLRTNWLPISTERASYVMDIGYVAGGFTANNCGVRPALWVHSSVFDAFTN